MCTFHIYLYIDRSQREREHLIISAKLPIYFNMKLGAQFMLCVHRAFSVEAHHNRSDTHREEHISAQNGK